LNPRIPQSATWRRGYPLSATEIQKYTSGTNLAIEKQYLRQMAEMGKNRMQAKNQLIDFIGLSKTHFWRK
jgi:hypothetical protein